MASRGWQRDWESGEEEEDSGTRERPTPTRAPDESPLQAGGRRVQHQPAELADTPPVRGVAPSSFYGGAGRQAPAARRSFFFGARMPQPAPAAPRAAAPAPSSRPDVAVVFFGDDDVPSISSVQLSTPPVTRTLSAQAREARKKV